MKFCRIVIVSFDHFYRLSEVPPISSITRYPTKNIATCRDDYQMTAMLCADDVTLPPANETFTSDSESISNFSTPAR